MFKFKKFSELPLRRIAYKYKVLIGITLFLIVAVVSFGTIFIKSYIDRNRDLRNAELVKDAENMLNSIENSLITVHKYYLASENNTKLRYVVENDVDYSKVSSITDAGDILDGGNIVSDYVASYSLVNFKTDTVLGTKGKYDIKEVKNLEELTDLYDTYKETYTKNLWVYIDGAEPDKYSKEYRTTVPLYGLNLVLFVPFSEVTPYALEVINIDMSQITSDIKKQLGENQQAALYTADGKLIFSTDKEFPKQIDMEKTDTNVIYSTKNDDGKRVYISAKTSSIAGLTLYVVNYSDRIELFVNAYYLIAFLLIVLLLFFGATILFNSIYKPIQTAIGEIEKSSDYKLRPGEDELQYLTDSVKKLDSKNTSLISHTTALFATRIYRNELTNTEIDQYLYRLSLSQKVPPFYRILTFVLKSVDEDSPVSSDRDKSICNQIIDRIIDDCGTKEFLPPVYYARSIVIFISCDGKGTEKELIEKNYNFMTQYVYNTFELNIGIGISSEYSDIYSINKAYLESVQALHYGKIDIGSYLSYYRMDAGMDQISFDSDIEEKLRRALRRGDKEEAYSVVDGLFEKLITMDVSRDNCVPVLLQLVNGIVLEVQTSGIGTSVFREELRQIYPVILDYNDLNRVRKYIKFNMIDPIIYHQNNVLDSQSANIMTAIEKLVEDKDGNITLNECAESLGYHTSYIWRILKEEKNLTFTEYVDKYKIKYAKKLLSETDMTVGAIAEKLNYTNSQNFIRFFNKMEGVTPGKYRQALKEA